MLQAESRNIKCFLSLISQNRIDGPTILSHIQTGMFSVNMGRQRFFVKTFHITDIFYPIVFAFSQVPFIFLSKFLFDTKTKIEEKLLKDKSELSSRFCSRPISRTFRGSKATLSVVWGRLWDAMQHQGLSCNPDFIISVLSVERFVKFFDTLIL